jgi:hypothetical protein
MSILIETPNPKTKKFKYDSTGFNKERYFDPETGAHFDFADMYFLTITQK